MPNAMTTFHFVLLSNACLCPAMPNIHDLKVLRRAQRRVPTPCVIAHALQALEALCAKQVVHHPWHALQRLLGVDEEPAVAASADAAAAAAVSATYEMPNPASKMASLSDTTKEASTPACLRQAQMERLRQQDIQKQQLLTERDAQADGLIKASGGSITPTPE